MAHKLVLIAALSLSLLQISASGHLEGGPLNRTSSWLKRTGSHFSRRFVLEDMQPVPARGTCRLSWYAALAPGFGSRVLCSGSGDACLQPCSNGYELLQGSGICIQKCPEAAVGPAHLCPVSRTCVRGDATCPMMADVPYLCTAPDQFIGSCAKQSYQAVVGSTDVNITCTDGIVLQDHTGAWQCRPAAGGNPCSPGFTAESKLQDNIGTRCKQACPAWLVDCGDTCNMPGVTCSTKTEQLCPVVPLKACDMEERSSMALETACQSAGVRGSSGCPLTLTMHGSCGGSKLQVAMGLHTQSFVSRVEVWWGPSANSQPWQLSEDGPLIAVRVSFTGDKQPEVFGNKSHTYTTSPRLAFNLQPSELLVSSRLWLSTTVMEGSRLTPVLAGFNLFTTARNLRTAGMDASNQFIPSPEAASAMQQRPQSVSLLGGGLGVGLPVGAAAYTSTTGIHAFGFVYLSAAAKQEL